MRRRPWVTIVGNGVAGFSCARSLAGAGARVTLVGPGLPCDRPPLSKRALLAGRPPYLASRGELAAAGIDHVDGWAEDLDLGRRTMRLRMAGGESRDARFELIVWATGLRPVRPPVPGIELAGENAEPQSLERLAPQLGQAGKRIVIVGAGLIGTETAATLAPRHQVTLLDMAARPLERFHVQASKAAHRVLQTLGVRFEGDCQIEAIESRPEGGRLVHLAGQGSIDVDVVISAAGVRSTLPEALGSSGFADTDERLALEGLDGVWVCGDLARHPHPRYGRIAVPHWDNARSGGAHVAAAILGSAAPFVREPYWFSDIGPLRIQQVGLQAEACEWRSRDGLSVGLDSSGRPTCVLLMNAPGRLAEARRLLAA